MLMARIKGIDGAPDKTVGADDLDKGTFYDLSAEHRLVCTDCDAPVTQVCGHHADGGTERIAHFRSLSVEDHKAGCINRDDPRAADRAVSLKRALAEGKPILVNIDIDPKALGFGGLRDQFNPLVNNTDSGLFSKKNWLETIGKDGHVSVPARDIADILYYLELAKEYGGQAAMKQLWFNTRHAVQACKRFIVADNQKQVGALLEQMIDRGRSSKNKSRELTDTPRLFLFKATPAQIKKAQTVRLHTLYGQLVEVEKPTSHVVKLGMRFKGFNGNIMTNQSVLSDGRDLWVVAIPTLARRRAHEIAAKADKRRADRVEPAFLLLRVKDRTQFVAVGTKPVSPAKRQKPAAPVAVAS